MNIPKKVNSLIIFVRVFSLLLIIAVAAHGQKTPYPSTLHVDSLGSICGVKFNDINGDGLPGAAEPGLAGWTINYFIPGIAGGSVLTDSLGHYCIDSLSPGTYTVCEKQQSGWTPTTPVCDTVTVIAGQTTEVLFGNKADTSECPNNLLVNGNFLTGLPPWGTGYGSPSYIAAPGADDFGYVQLYGNRDEGSAIYQSVNIQQGKVYELRLNVRRSNSSVVDYVKLRAVAFNGILPSTGNHPSPNSNLAIMDISGKITAAEWKADGGWSTYVFHRWKAHNNFTGMAINVENNFPFLPLQSVADIDNICLREVGDTIDCYLVDLDSLGNIIYPDSLDPDNPPVLDTVDVFMGSVSDLYAPCGANDGVDTWYDNCPDSCASIGGELPDSLLNCLHNPDSCLQSTLNQLGITDSTSQILDSLLALEDSLQGYAGNLLDTLFSLGAIDAPCDTIVPKGPPPDPINSPFGGRDIVFVHGFRTEPMEDRLCQPPSHPSHTRWPTHRSQFYNEGGYWKDGANEYWREHIQKYLGRDPAGTTPSGYGYKNRFIVVAHPATQSGIFAVHAILDQIAKAMRYGQGVKKCDPNEQRPDNTFGRDGYVIISHSAGSLFSNVALSFAELVRTNMLLNLMIGDIGYIAERCDLHIAIQGAFMGSNYATLALLVAPAASSSPLLQIANNFLPWGTCIPTPLDLWLYTSQLLDMAIPRYIYGGELFKKLKDNIQNNDPNYNQNPWYWVFKALAQINLIERTPMDVITVAGGHPSEYGLYGGGSNPFFHVVAKNIFHHGFDDGVLSIDCQCGNTDLRVSYQNRYLPKPGLLTIAAWAAGIAAIASGGSPDVLKVASMINERIYDMGIPPQRAIGYYLDQKLDLWTSDIMRNIVCNTIPSVCPSQDPLQQLSNQLPSSWGAYIDAVRYLFASTGCVPWLSPTGMVQPVLVSRLPGQASYDALKRMENTNNNKKHYSFLQSAADHYAGSIDLINNNVFPNYYESYGKKNWEEVRVVNSNDVYNKGLVSTQMISLQVEEIKGKKITFTIKIFGKRFSKTFWIWKRKYHRLEDTSTSINKTDRNQLYYVYKYVLR
ncbi:MAG: hypothetical protein HY707_05620 [Ignavibacteriae bacterium]|nr:hypothetical protein [Ignavibacteriota bacterium]